MQTNVSQRERLQLGLSWRLPAACPSSRQPVKKEAPVCSYVHSVVIPVAQVGRYPGRGSHSLNSIPNQSPGLRLHPVPVLLREELGPSPRLQEAEHKQQAPSVEPSSGDCS